MTDYMEQGDTPGFRFPSGYEPSYLPFCKPGQQLEVRLELLAPPDPGTWVTYFRLKDKAGREFGQRLWCYANVSATVAQLEGAPPVEEGGYFDTDPLPPVVARGEAERQLKLERADVSYTCIELFCCSSSLVCLHSSPFICRGLAKSPLSPLLPLWCLLVV